MGYDFSKLRGKITEVMGTSANFAKAMHMSEHTLSKRLTGALDWRQDEILKACNLLGVSMSDIPVYFFTLKVHKM